MLPICVTDDFYMTSVYITLSVLYFITEFSLFSLFVHPSTLIMTILRYFIKGIVSNISDLHLESIMNYPSYIFVKYCKKVPKYNNNSSSSIRL
jgi:hypothetical protein